jgi:hypothetical protein
VTASASHSLVTQPWLPVTASRGQLTDRHVSLVRMPAHAHAASAVAAIAWRLPQLQQQQSAASFTHHGRPAARDDRCVSRWIAATLLISLPAAPA